MNKMFDHLASNEIEGPHLQIQILSKREIVPPAETKLAIKSLLNYDEHCIDTTDQLFDRIYTSKYSSYESSLCIDNLDKIFDDSLEYIFRKSIEDHDFPLSQNFNAYTALKSAVDEVYVAADDIGVKGIQKMNELLHKFKSWCNKKQYNNCESSDEKRYVPMTQENYKGTAKRVLNTYSMH